MTPLLWTWALFAVAFPLSTVLVGLAHGWRIRTILEEMLPFACLFAVFEWLALERRAR